MKIRGFLEREERKVDGGNKNHLLKNNKNVNC